MVVKLAVLIFLAAIVVFSESAFVDTLPKCSIKDETCLRNFYKTVITDIATAGIPELNIVPVDPLILKNFSVSILGLVDFTIVDGDVRGIKNCEFIKHVLDVEKGRGHTEVVCDLVIEGKYKAFSDSPVIKELLGGATGASTVRGEGYGKTEFEKIRVQFSYPIHVQRRDGENYIIFEFDKKEYDFEVMDNVKFYGDNFYLGEEESSEFIIKFMNDNWKLVVNTFGKVFVEKALDVFFEINAMFFDNVPAKYYITDDLTSYAKP